MDDKITWCCKQKRGIELIEPKEHLNKSYLLESEQDLMEIKNVGEKWKMIIAYYSCYGALYSIMMKCGIKSEIHECTFEFMKKCLTELYSEDDIKLIDDAFDYRNQTQYYPGKTFDEKKADNVKLKVSDFFIKSKEIIAKITEENINKIRGTIKNE